MQEIDRLRADLTDFGRQAVAYWLERTGCSELEALRHVSGGPALLQPGHKLGRGWRTMQNTEPYPIKPGELTYAYENYCGATNA